MTPGDPTMATDVRAAFGHGGDFPQPTHEQWRDMAEKILLKSGFLREPTAEADTVEQLLSTTTLDDITVRPLYTEGPGDGGLPGLAPFVRGSNAEGCITSGWDVRQPYAHPDAEQTRQEIGADLAAGTTSLWLRLGATGLSWTDLDNALRDVALDSTGVVLDAGADFASAATALLDLASARDVPRGALRGNLGVDPIGALARTGVSPDEAAATELARRCAEGYQGLRAIVVDGLPYHDAGGSDAEELGCTLAAATTYLRWLTAAGLDVDTACGLLEFRYSASADQFLTIAKLRAARRLWDQVTRACGASEPSRAQAQHAVTSSAMLTRRDPWTNILRATVAAFAAGAGGAGAVTVQPFDAAIGLPDEFSRRLARNTQSLLLAEAQVARVIDPAGGSWYVESLTDQLAEASWNWFRSIEATGGMTTALDSGVVADRLATTWQRRREAIADRGNPIVGVSEFPDLNEQPVRREPAPPQPSGGLPRNRYAEDFERLRERADRDRPTVFLATLGPLAAYNAQALFARNLFAAGGIVTPEAGPTESIKDAVDAFASAETTLACLCSGAKVDSEQIQEAAAALRAAGADLVLVAARPADVDGIDGFVHAGSDALTLLEDIHRRWSHS